MDEGLERWMGGWINDVCMDGLMVGGSVDGQKGWVGGIMDGQKGWVGGIMDG